MIAICSNCCRKREITINKNLQFCSKILYSVPFFFRFWSCCSLLYLEFLDLECILWVLNSGLLLKKKFKINAKFVFYSETFFFHLTYNFKIESGRNKRSKQIWILHIFLNTLIFIIMHETEMLVEWTAPVLNQRFFCWFFLFYLATTIFRNCINANEN